MGVAKVSEWDNEYQPCMQIMKSKYSTRRDIKRRGRRRFLEEPEGQWFCAEFGNARSVVSHTSGHLKARLYWLGFRGFEANEVISERSHNFGS